MLNEITLLSVIVRISLSILIGGILGAGTIIVTQKDEIRGLTTAAGLWVAAGLGLAIGSSFYAGALIGGGFCIFALISLKKIDVYIKKHARSMEIYLEYNSAFSRYSTGTSFTSHTPLTDRKNTIPSRCILPLCTRYTTGCPCLAPTLTAVS